MKTWLVVAAFLTLLMTVFVMLIDRARRRLLVVFGFLLGIWHGGAAAGVNHPDAAISKGFLAQSNSPTTRYAQKDTTIGQTVEWRFLADVWARLDGYEKAPDGNGPNEGMNYYHALEKDVQEVKKKVETLELAKYISDATAEGVEHIIIYRWGHLSHKWKGHVTHTCYITNGNLQERIAEEKDLERQYQTLSELRNKGVVGNGAFEKVFADIKHKSEKQGQWLTPEALEFIAALSSSDHPFAKSTPKTGFETDPQKRERHKKLVASAEWKNLAASWREIVTRHVKLRTATFDKNDRNAASELEEKLRKAFTGMTGLYAQERRRIITKVEQESLRRLVDKSIEKYFEILWFKYYSAIYGERESYRLKGSPQLNKAFDDLFTQMSSLQRLYKEGDPGQDRLTSIKTRIRADLKYFDIDPSEPFLELLMKLNAP